MQNGSVTKDENLRSVGRFYSAIRRQYRQTVQGVGVKTVDNRTSSPQEDWNGSRSNSSNHARTLPTWETRVSSVRELIHLLQCRFVEVHLKHLRCFLYHSVCKKRESPAIHGESLNTTHSVIGEWRGSIFLQNFDTTPEDDCLWRSRVLHSKGKVRFPHS